jgi:hypothetical protein
VIPGALPKGSPTRSLPDISKLEALGLRAEGGAGPRGLGRDARLVRRAGRWRHDPARRGMRPLRQPEPRARPVARDQPTDVRHGPGRPDAPRGPTTALDLLRCPDCTLVQLSVIVDPETVFPPDYPYSSGNSTALHENFEDLARQADRGSGRVACGRSRGGHRRERRDAAVKFHCRTVGVEPTGQARKINGTAYEEFFTAELAQRSSPSTGRRRSSPPATSSRTSRTSTT